MVSSVTLSEVEQLNRRQHKRKQRDVAFKVVKYAIMIILAIILLFPFMYMVSKSLMTSEEVIDKTIKMFPQIPQFINYLEVFSNAEAGTVGYLGGTLNTLIVVGFNIVAVTISASLIAFSFAKLKWIGRNFMFAIMLVTMMLPSIATQLPLYVMYNSFGWIDTLLPFTIPNLFGGGALYIFLIRQFMMGIPRDIDNAAKIDGANAFRRYFAISLPMCKSVLVYVVVSVIIAYWGDYYGPLMYMSSSDAPKTLALVVFERSTEANAAMDKANIRMAAGVFMSIIPAVLFAFFQKSLIEGVNAGSIKG